MASVYRSHFKVSSKIVPRCCVFCRLSAPYVTADAEIKVSFDENWDMRGSLFCAKGRAKCSLERSSTARNFAFPVFVFPVHSSTFFPSPHTKWLTSFVKSELHCPLWCLKVCFTLVWPSRLTERSMSSVYLFLVVSGVVPLLRPSWRFFFLSLDLFWCHCLRPEKQGLIVFPSSFPSAPWMVCVRHAHVLLLLSWGSRYDKGSAGVPLPPPAPTPVRSAPLALWPYTGVDSIYSVFLYLGGDLVFSRSSACF